MFKALADVDYKGKVCQSKLISNQNNFNLTVFSYHEDKKNEVSETIPYEFTKFDFLFKKGLNNTVANRTLKIKDIWDTDETSVIQKAEKYQLRLPFGSMKYQSNKKYRAI